MWCPCFSKSTAATIPMYYRTNNGVGSDNENIQFSDSATTTPGSTDTSFNQYGVTNIEFSLKANLAPGRRRSLSLLTVIILMAFEKKPVY